MSPYIALNSRPVHEPESPCLHEPPRPVPVHDPEAVSDEFVRVSIIGVTVFIRKIPSKYLSVTQRQVLLSA